MLLSLCEESGEHNSNFGRVTATFHVFGSRNGFLVDTKDVAGIKKDRGVPEYLIGNPVRIGSGPAAVTSFWPFWAENPFTFCVTVRHFWMGRPLKGEGSQKTCHGEKRPRLATVQS